MKSKTSKEDEINKRLEKIKSLIKVWPFRLCAATPKDKILSTSGMGNKVAEYLE